MEQKNQFPTTKVDQRMFDCVKILLQSGETHEKIAEMLKLSKATVGRIARSETLVEYKNIMSAWKMEQRKKREDERLKMEAEKKLTTPMPTQAPRSWLEPQDQRLMAAPLMDMRPKPEPRMEMKPVNVTVQTTHYVSQKLDAIADLLKGISAKLAFVVDELTVVPVKKEEKE